MSKNVPMDKVSREEMLEWIERALQSCTGAEMKVGWALRDLIEQMPDPEKVGILGEMR